MKQVIQSIEGTIRSYKDELKKASEKDYDGLTQEQFRFQSDVDLVLRAEYRRMIDHLEGLQRMIEATL